MYSAVHFSVNMFLSFLLSSMPYEHDSRSYAPPSPSSSARRSQGHFRHGLDYRRLAGHDRCGCPGGHGGTARRRGTGAAGRGRPLPGYGRRLRAFVHDGPAALRRRRPHQRGGPHANRGVGPRRDYRRHRAGTGPLARSGPPRPSTLQGDCAADGLRRRRLERPIDPSRSAGSARRTAGVHAASRRVRPARWRRLSGRGSASRPRRNWLLGAM